jgi:hypothetical protein
MDSTSTVSVWQAILVAALAGVGGGLLGTWARIRYERTAELRSRMIQAADDFATAAFRTIAGIRDLPKTIQDLGDVILIPVRDKGKLQFHPDVEQATAIAVGLADELQERFARVQVLFGIQGESAATLHAWIAIVSVRNCVNVLRMAPGSLLPNVTPDDAGLKQWNENFGRVVNELDSFSQSARVRRLNRPQAVAIPVAERALHPGRPSRFSPYAASLRLPRLDSNQQPSG